jgi:hypothetical protein
MNNIKQTYVCPRCEEGITASQKPKTCAGCGYKFSTDNLDQFGEPETISEQAERINNKKLHAEFILSLPIESANNIVQDALDIIKTLPGKKVKVTDIRTIMGLAIKIGEIAKQYESFLVAGGTHTPELLMTTGDTKDESQKTANGDATATRIPTPLFASMGEDDRGGDDIIPR